MKSFSTNDLVLIPELAGMSMFDFMSPANDFKVNPYLYEMGAELNLGLEYRICHHRTLAGKGVVGLQIVGEIRTDREFLSGPWSTAEDRMVAAGRYDRSLGNELSKSMNVQISYGNVYALDSEESMKELWQDLEDIERIEAEIESLNLVLKDVRGEQRRKDGSMRRPKDYHEPEVYEKVRKKKAFRSTLKHRELA